MKFRYIIPFIAPLILASCKKEKPLLAVNKTPVVKDTFIHISPLKVNLNPLSKEYINTTHHSIDHFFHKNWPHNTLNGGFLVAKNGHIIYEQYGGYADRAKKTEITADTPIQLASVSKVLTASVVLKLIDEGKLSLDQKINTVLPEFPYDAITVKMLLNHRSGLPNYNYFSDNPKIWNHSMMCNQDVLDLMVKNKIDLYFKPDSKFGYCNTNYAMLALVIEKVTGMNYRDAMKKMLFDPLGMDHTYVFDYNKDKDTATRSYKGNNVLYKFDFLDNVYGDKDIYSTPRDLLKFDLATYSDKFLSPDLRKQVFKGYSYEHAGEKNYGLGIRMHEWKNGKKLFYHNGWWHGNTTSYVTLKKDTVAIIALSNKFTYKTYQVWKLATLFDDYPIKDTDDLLE